MKNKYAANFFRFLCFTFLFSLTAIPIALCVVEPQLYTEISGKVEKVMQNQQEIVRRLAEMKDEIGVVKIRISLKSH